MVKVKNHKRVSVDEIQKKRQKQNVKKTLNPFEVHINKEKMKVLGKKMKNQRGVPGISRAKAIQKRKQTLLPEYKLQNKSNKFLDKRIGEKSNMSIEEKVAARFAAFKAKSHSRQSIFNLSGDVLSHKDHTLSEIEKFEDLHSDEGSDDEDDMGKLDSEFVEQAHFGNGVLTNTGKEGVKTHKQLIDQLIEESKKRKVEQQKIKEATFELTEKLDSEWKDLVPLVTKSNKKDNNQMQEKSSVDDYDKYMRELRFEARGTVSDRLKTEDEIAKEEKEKLEKLESERIERMRGVLENITAKKTHRSADDLDDDFVYESDTEENVLSYDISGQSNVQVQAEINGKFFGKDQQQDEQNEEKMSDSDEEHDEDDNEDDSDSNDSLADLKQDETDDDEQVIEDTNEKELSVISTKEFNETPKEKKGKKRKSESIDQNECKMQKVNKLKENEIAESEKKELEKIGNELPFTFTLPNSYEEFMETINEKSHQHKKIILERMIKCNHPSLAQGNKESLGGLFDYLLQYLNDLFSDVENATTLKENFKLFSILMPNIYDLAQLNPENAHNSILEVIKEKHQEYRKKKKTYPGIEVLIFLKLVSLLFSTSDFRHQIVTPCFVFIEQMLKNCSVKTAADVAYGLFLCTLVLEYTSLSNRFLPATINFLCGVIHMAIPKTSIKVIKAPSPFKSLRSDLVIIKKQTKLLLNEKTNVTTLISKEFTDEFKVSALHLTFKLLSEFKDTFKNYPSNVEIFSKVETFVPLISWDLYPEKLKNEQKIFIDGLDKLKSERKLHYLVLEEKRPKALRLYEPKIEKVYDGKRYKVRSKERADNEKLLRKLKKETKGALREIRADKAFLAKVKIRQRIESDKERREKVNKIFAEAASQQNELNTMDRKKKKK